MRSPAVAVGFALVVVQIAVTAQSRVVRHPDGHPDLTGYWTNDSFTPLERSPELGNKEFFTPEEAASYFKQRLDRLVGQARDDIHYDDALWQAETYAKQPNLRTSMVFDPPDGRLPPLTAAAQGRDRERREAASRRGPADSAQSRTLGERCISWGNVGPPMLPPTYNANFQILETSEAVILTHEMVHDTRIIYMDRPHVSAGIRLLAGDSRARWEGDTLVVDTTNFTNETNFRGSPQTTRQDIFASDALHVVERLTPLDAQTIRYRFTVEDPKTWTRSWSGESTFHRWEGPLYEYACHEGNYGLANILRAARAAEVPRASDPAATSAVEPQQPQPQKPYSELTPRPMWAEKVKEGLFVVRGPLGPCLPMPCPAVATPVNPDGLLHEPGDVAVRVTPEGLIIVDTKFAYNVPELLAVIKTISDKPIKYVLASHYHGDHNGGIGELIKLGATVVVNESLRDAYARSTPQGSSPQVTFGEYGAIHLGGVTVEMHHFATGHTRGDTFVYFPDLKVVHTGDVAVEGMPTFDYRDGASAVGWVKEMYDLLKLDFDWAIPGHGRLLTKDEIRQYVKNVEIMNDRMKELVRQGVPVEEAGKRLKLDDLGWARSASTNTFLVGGSIPGYYDEMKAVLEQEQKLGPRR